MKHLVIVLSGKLVNFIDPLGARLVLGVLEFMQETITGFLQDRIESRAQIIKQISIINPDVIWISIQPSAQNVHGFISELISHTKSPIILGNIGARILKLTDFKRRELFIVRGQGEDAVCSLVQYFRRSPTGERRDYSLSLIKNLMWISCDNSLHCNEIHTTKLAKSIIPSDFLLREAINRSDVITARSSTGCSGSCTFCSIKSIGNQIVWEHYPYKILFTWLTKIINAGGRKLSIYMTDDNLADDIYNLKQVANIFATINSQYNAELTFIISARSDCLINNRDDSSLALERIKIWKYATQSGLKKIFLGLESGSDTQLIRLGKRISVKQNYAAIDLAAALGIEIDMGFIPIDPLMKKEQWKQEMLDNIKLAKYCYNNSSDLSLTWLAQLRVYLDSGYYRTLTKKGLLRNMIDLSEEYTYDYECDELHEFLLNLGPLLCDGQNDYFRFKKEFKVITRFPVAIAETFSNLGKELLDSEMKFVEYILNEPDSDQLNKLRSAFVKTTSDTMIKLANYCEPHRKNPQIAAMIATLDGAIKTLENWAAGKWSKEVACYL